MNTHPTPLLLLVQSNVDPVHEDTYNDWYEHHVPTLLKIPGYAWGRRYVNQKGDRKYLAMYQIDDASVLPSLLGPDEEKRHALANSEFAAFGKLKGVTDTSINVYEQLSGSHLGHPLLAGDYPISVVTMECSEPAKETEFNDWYTHWHVPALVRIPGYVSGARFRLVEHPALKWLDMGPRYLALYELADLECIPSLSDPERMHPAAAAEFAEYQAFAAPLSTDMSWNIYRPLSRHWRAD